MQPAQLLNPRAAFKSSGTPNVSHSPTSTEYSSYTEPHAESHPATVTPRSTPPPSASFHLPSFVDSAQSYLTTFEGSPQSKQVNGNASKASLPRFDPKALLNPKAAANRSKVGEGDGDAPVEHSVTDSLGSPSRLIHANGVQNEELQGGSKWGSMIERVHNVGNREDQPRKKQKKKHETEEDEEEIKKKAIFSGGGAGRGTEIGGYLKQKRDEGTKAAGPPGSVVDLTAEADDEVIFVKDTGDRQVCLGKLQDAKVMAHRIPSQRIGGFQGSSGQWPVMKVTLNRRPGTNIIAVIDPCGKDFGNVDARTAVPLAPLMDAAGLNKLRVQARLEMRKRLPGQMPGQPVSDYYQLSIILYAPRKMADGIGRFLSQRQVWLRTPIGSDRNIEIYNPHVPPSARPGGTSISGFSSNGYVAYNTRTKEEVRSDVLSVFDSLKQSDTLPETDPDPRITTPLLRHQKQGLTFMIAREGNTQADDEEEVEEDEGSLWKPKVQQNGQRVYEHVLTGQTESVKPPPALGGILADMMGLGKTLSILALIVGSLEKSRKWLKQKPPQRDKHDEIQLRRNAATTLLVCPLSTVANWEEQIKAHVEDGTLSCHIYHGGNRTKDIDELSRYKLVITTYSIVASEFARDPTKSPLQQINWFRIVLDEAHMIREQSTLQSRAACALSAQRRWAVTGTPVQNRLDDLGALIKFLRIKPFDERGNFAQYILAPFKNADPEILPKLRVLVDSITLRRLKDRIDLPKRIDQIVELEFTDAERGLYEWFARYSDQRVQAVTGNTQNSKLGARVYAHILRAILRLRLICAHGQELLNDEDMKLLDGYTQSTAIDLEDEDEDKPALTQKEVFDMLHLLRESDMDRCAKCHNTIEPKENPSEDPSGDTDEIIGYMLPCYQIICQNCIGEVKQLVSEKKTPDNFVVCPLCTQYVRAVFYEISQSKVEEDEEARERAKENPRLTKQVCRYNGPHTKTRALLQDLNNHKEWSLAHPEEPPIKSVVFSSWTTHLDLIQVALDDAHIPFVRLDGKMTRAKRSVSLTTFRDDPSVPIILVSLQAGGLGLNLTTASRVYVMEPQFNPAAEQQAVDRVHRLGQTREVVIKRFIMKDSFEEKMLVLQRKKQNLADLSLDRASLSKIDKEDAAKRKLEELRSLFR